MKRNKYASMIKILFSCLVVAITCFAFACLPKKPDEAEKETNIDFTDATEWSFESLDEIYECFSFASAFGRVSLNSDAQYVTKDTHSLKIESIGTYNPSLSDPSMCIRLADISSTGVYDFSKIKSVSFDIFNMNEEAQTLSVNFTSDGRTTNMTQVTVEPGKTANCTVDVNVRAMQLTTDMSKATQVQIYFPAVEEFEGDPYVFYMDNLKLNFHESAQPPYEMERDGDEICSFDKEYQQYIVFSGAIGPATGCLPTTEINTDPAYATSGSSLKATYPTGTLPLDDGWPYWSFTQGFLETIDFKAYADEEAFIVFDVYTPAESGYLQFQVQFSYKPTVDENGKTQTVAGGIYYVTPTPGEWTQVRIPASTWNKFYDAEGNPVDTGIKELRLLVTKFADPAKTFYFDNFRFEIPDNRDTVGKEDFSKKPTDKTLASGFETKVETSAAKAVSPSGAKPHFYGKYSGGNARTEYVLCVHNDPDSNDIYYEYETSVFDFAEEGDTATLDAWGYKWSEPFDKWDEERMPKLFNSNWVLEFYEYRADGKYDTAKPVYEYKIGHCGAGKWAKGIEISAEAVATFKEDGKFVFRINTTVQTGCYEYELFLDNLTLVKADVNAEIGFDLEESIKTRFADLTATIVSVTRDGKEVTLEGGKFTEAGTYTVTVTVGSNDYKENTFELVYVITDPNGLNFSLPADKTVKVGDTVDLSSVKANYLGEEILPTIRVIYNATSVSLKDNTFMADKAGEYIVMYTFNYGDNQTKSFTQRINAM